MRNYLELDFDHKQYHDRLVNYVMSILDTRISAYHSVDLQKFKNHNIDLCSFLENTADSNLERVIILSIGDIIINSPVMNDLKPHHDNGPRVCRINWPILNSSSAYTIFYKAKPGVEPFKIQNIKFYHKHDLEVCDTFILEKPTLMHIDTIHSVDHIEGKSLPRIIISFNFKDDSKLAQLLK